VNSLTYYIKTIKTYTFDTVHTSDISEVKTILMRSCQGALLAIEPTLYYFISKDSNHVQGGINKITLLCTPYVFFALV